MFDISEVISETFNSCTKNKLDTGLPLVGFLYIVLWCNPLNAVNGIPTSSPFGFVETPQTGLWDIFFKEVSIKHELCPRGADMRRERGKTNGSWHWALTEYYVNSPWYIPCAAFSCSRTPVRVFIQGGCTDLEGEEHMLTLINTSDKYKSLSSPK